jgi:dihydrodipicolinate synthase/N-acetylneuraminate lyase
MRAGLARRVETRWPVANVAPGLVADLYEAVRVGDIVRARAVHFLLGDLNGSTFFATNSIPIRRRTAGVLRTPARGIARGPVSRGRV